MYKFVVAVWLGKFHSEGDLDAFMAFDPEHPFRAPSIFGNEIGMEKIEADLVEHSFRQGLPWELVLDRHSYSGYFREEFLQALKDVNPEADYNALILLFGQRSRYGIENPEVFDLDLNETGNAPLVGIGKFEFTAL